MSKSINDASAAALNSKFKIQNSKFKMPLEQGFEPQESWWFISAALH
ncbi:MAG: hypothetical protein F6J93_20970 [Oscillatoria sp. SIO1A7]|nr:hypothetical protein [Oscillatoria sp. SIO1A7]